MSKNYEKLRDLKFRQMSLPPKVGLYTGSECGQEVITVHNGMYQGIESSGEDDEVTKTKIRGKPNEEYNGHMMKYMKECHLAVLLP